MKRSLRGAKVLIGVVAAMIGSELWAQAGSGKRWFVSMDVQGLAGSYSESSARESLDNVGFFVHADYFERAGITIGYNRTKLDFTGGDDDLDQNTLFLSGRFGLTPDSLDGRLTLRLDAYDISNDVSASVSEPGRVAMSQIAYLNFARTFYWDLGFARSDYSETSTLADRLELDQLTPTIGLALNRQRDWIQLRAYLIDIEAAGGNPLRDDTSAIELKWTHWLSSDGLLGLAKLQFSLLGGERLLAVDPDAATIYDLSDLQTGGFSAGGEWDIGDNGSLLLVAGIEEFENQGLREEYRSSFLYLNFSHEWK